MNNQTVVVKYHNRKMLATVDLNTLIDVLMRTYGDSRKIYFEPMSDGEREETLEDYSGSRAILDSRTER